MIRGLLAAGVLLGGAGWVFASAAAGDKARAALLDGQLPDDPARPLVQGKCLLCHSAEYVTSQRLTEGQWQKTVEKMRKFGSPATDEEAKEMTAYFARFWTPDLPPPRVRRAPPPTGSARGK